MSESLLLTSSIEKSAKSSLFRYTTIDTDGKQFCCKSLTTRFFFSEILCIYPQKIDYILYSLAFIVFSIMTKVIFNKKKNITSVGSAFQKKN